MEYSIGQSMKGKPTEHSTSHMAGERDGLSGQPLSIGEEMRSVMKVMVLIEEGGVVR